MRTPTCLCLLLICMLISCTPTQEKHEIDYTSYVNPFIGTDFTGNTYPGAQAPFGMVQLSPDNGLPGWDRISGYFYPDSTIAGFSHTHLSGTGAGDLYDISFMPVTLPYKEAEAPLGIHSKFSHDDESAYAGYYQVRLTDYNINVELTATERCGIQRYTFPEAQSAIFLNLKKAMNWDFTNDSHIEVIDSVTIQGYRFSDGWTRDQHIYFRTRFSKPFEKIELDTMAIVKENKRIGTATIARFDFNTQEGEQILVSTAISGVSMEGAAKNLQAEVPENNFDKYLAATKANWNRQLGKIEVKSDNEDDKFKSEPFLREVKEIYTDLINRHISNPEQQLKVFDKNSVYLPTKKIGKNNPKAAEIETDNAARQEWNRTADMALISGISEAKILEVKQTEIHDKASQSIKSKGWLPNLFRGIVTKAKDFLQNLIQEKDLPSKPTLDINMAEFRTMQKLMIKAQDKAKEIRHLQDTVLPKLKQQLADTKGIFKGKECKALTEQIQRTEKEIAEKLDKLPDVLKEDGYPDVQAFMATYRKAEAVVEQYNRDLAAWEREVRENRRPAEKERLTPPEKKSIRDQLRRLQAESRQRSQPKRKSHDRESRAVPLPCGITYILRQRNTLQDFEVLQGIGGSFRN